jgi:tRNA(fMet)-specific endonuclease VapC
VFHRFIQHAGRLYIPTPVLGELHAWVLLADDSSKRKRALADFLQDINILSFDEECAKTFGRVKAEMQKSGLKAPGVDMLIGSMALTHDLTMVTHNTADYHHIPNLRLEDWLAA